MTAPRPSIFSSWSDHCWRVMCCSVMRVVLWHDVQAAFTLACMGPAGSGLPGALGAWALARMMEVNRKIAGKTRWSKQDPHTLTAAGADLESPPTGAENMVAGIAGSGLWALSSQFSV